MSAIADALMVSTDFSETPESSIIADDTGEFTELLRRFMTNEQETAQLDADFMQREKLRLEAEMLDTILKRIGKNSGFAASINQVLAWFGNRRGEFLAQAKALSEMLPKAGEDLFAALTGMYAAFAGKFRETSGTGGVRSVIQNFQVDFTVQFDFASLMSQNRGRQFTDEQIKNALGVNRATVKLEIVMQAVAAESTIDVGDTNATLKFISENLSLNAGLKFYDPLVLDLGGDGVNLKSLAQGVTFALAGDQAIQRCGFVQGNDALLFLDRDGNGLCDNGYELFGDQEGHRNGFEKLRESDSNHDGVIDEFDEIYERLQVWNDWNDDGVNTADENRGLCAAGIKAINLNYHAENAKNNGNLITERGSFTTFANEIRAAIDAQFLCAG